MRWYDYIAALLLADIISAGIVYVDPLMSVYGIILYLMYENLRTTGYLL